MLRAVLLVTTVDVPAFITDIDGHQELLVVRFPEFRPFFQSTPGCGNYLRVYFPVPPVKVALSPALDSIDSGCYRLGFLHALVAHQGMSYVLNVK